MSTLKPGDQGKMLKDLLLEGEEKSAEDSLEQRYSNLDHLLRADIDAQFDIKRSIVQSERYPTGFAVVRDATRAKAITDPSTDHYRVEANNMLLRALGRLRGIDHALIVMRDKLAGKPTREEQEELRIYGQLRAQLKEQFAKLLGRTFEQVAAGAESEKAYNQALSKLEKAFNTEVLCDVLHQSHLDEGCASKKDYKKLLSHYRELAVLIDPAKSLVTISFDKENKVLHRITQDPIAQKLPKQKAAIEADMSELLLYPTGIEKTFQTNQKLALQIANRCFAALAVLDDRMLGSQARKIQLHGMKNAFFVTTELVFGVAEGKLNRLIEMPAEESDRQSFIRSATPVYVGNGETDERIRESTRKNIEQVRQFTIEKRGLEGADAKQLAIHNTCLITDSPFARQSLMLRHVYDAMRTNPNSRDDISYLPCNWDGTHRRLNLAVKIDLGDKPSTAPTPSNQAERYRRAAQISLKVRGQSGVIELVSCASGQDRTGTESEYATQQWMEERYASKGIILVADPDKGNAVEQTCAVSRNAADINAHLVGGSRGCKEGSRGTTVIVDYDNLYSPETDKAMYLASARTNKNSKVDEKVLKELVAKPSAIAEQQYQLAYRTLQEACAAPLRPQTGLAGKDVLKEVAAAKKHILHQNQGVLIRTMQAAIPVVKGEEVQKEPLRKVVYAKKISRLGAIVKELNKKSSFKKLGGVLLALAGVALVAAGILFAIPSGGSSLLATVLGAKAIALAAMALGVKAMIGVGTTAVIAGAVAAHTGKKIVRKHARKGAEKKQNLIHAVKKLDQTGKKSANSDSKIEVDPSLQGPGKKSS